MGLQFKRKCAMNGIHFIADTNAIIYLLSGKPYMKQYEDARFGVSVITEMELLSFPRITPTELSNLKALLSDCIIFPLDTAVKDRAIHIRRTYGTKLPDSIVAATSLECAVPLITADKGFKKILELDLRLLEPES